MARLAAPLVVRSVDALHALASPSYASIDSPLIPALVPAQRIGIDRALVSL
jgi:hypothetical protein